MHRTNVESALSQEIARSGWRRPFAAQAEHSVLKYKAHIIQRDIENPRAQETNPNSRHTREVVRIKQWQKVFFKAMWNVKSRSTENYSSREREALIKKSLRVCSISTSWHFAEKETLSWRQVSGCKEFFKVVKLRGSFGAFHWNLRKFRLIFRRKKKRASKYRDTRHKRRKDSSRSEDGSTFSCRKRQHAPSGLAYTWATDLDPANYDRERPVSPLRDHLCTHFGKLCGHATYVLLSGCFRNECANDTRTSLSTSAPFPLSASDVNFSYWKEVIVIPTTFQLEMNTWTMTVDGGQ